jgi:putative membrane protein
MRLQGWLHAKLTLVALLVAYHVACMRLAAGFARGSNRRSARWYRVFNEAPALLLVAIVLCWWCSSRSERVAA